MGNMPFGSAFNDHFWSLIPNVKMLFEVSFEIVGYPSADHNSVWIYVCTKRCAETAELYIIREHKSSF